MIQKKEQEVYFAIQGKHSLDSIFVTKNFFFQVWASKMFFDLHVSCRPGRLSTNQHILKSGLSLLIYHDNSYYKMSTINAEKIWYERYILQHSF